MPVSPDKQRLYPGGSLRSPEWQALRRRILVRAGHRCEQPDCRARNYLTHPDTGSEVRLTIAHVDQDETNNDEANLRAWCQRCHNRHDARTRQLHAAETRRRKMCNLHLFEDTPCTSNR